MPLNRSFRAVARWLTPAAAAPLIATVAIVPAHAAPLVPNAPFKARTQAAGNRCLDADLGTITTLVTKVQLWDCNFGEQQVWNTRLWSNSTVAVWTRIRPNWCMDANPSGWNGTVVELRECNGSTGQQWQVRGLNSPYRIVHIPTGLCLEAAAATVGHNGSTIQLWDCNGQPHQGWATVYTAAPARPIFP
jgi:hypothetical protein